MPILIFIRTPESRAFTSHSNLPPSPCPHSSWEGLSGDPLLSAILILTGLVVIREHWNSTAGNSEISVFYYSQLPFRLVEKGRRNSSDVSFPSSTFPLPLSTKVSFYLFTDQLFFWFVFCGVGFVFVFFFIESCFPSQTAFSSSCVYYTQHRKGWKRTNLGRETKACNKLYSQLPCSTLTGNKKTCHADIYSWKLGLLCAGVLKKAFHRSPRKLPLCYALRKHSITYWHRYKNVLWTRDSSGKL